MQNFVNTEFKHYKKYENMLYKEIHLKILKHSVWDRQSNSRGGGDDDCIFQVIHNKIM